jgi:hypothetical protein
MLWMPDLSGTILVGMSAIGCGADIDVSEYKQSQIGHKQSDAGALQFELRYDIEYESTFSTASLGHTKSTSRCPLIHSNRSPQRTSVRETSGLCHSLAESTAVVA